MYPHERSLVKQLPTESFAIIGVNSDKDREKLQETVVEKDLSWRSFWNGPKGTGGPISAEWRVTGWPTIYLLDDKGVIRYKNVRGDDLDAAITELLGEMEIEVSISHAEEDEPDDAS